MGPLVGYASSDEEGDHQDEQKVTKESAAQHRENPADQKTVDAGKQVPGGRQGSVESAIAAKPQPSDAPSRERIAPAPAPQNAVPLGPALPPMEESMMGGAGEPNEEPSSPYSANRALLHDLTLPSVPNLDIPPSPPGSPPPELSKRFEQFLELKRKGTHFNAKLERSSALRNPSLMDKLMAFVDVDERSQYDTTLSRELWDPSAFPDHAYRERLRKSREKMVKERESQRASGTRNAVEFVAASTTSSVDGSANAIGGIARGEKRKSNWQ